MWVRMREPAACHQTQRWGCVSHPRHSSRGPAPGKHHSALLHTTQRDPALSGSSGSTGDRRSALATLLACSSGISRHTLFSLDGVAHIPTNSHKPPVPPPPRAACCPRSSPPHAPPPAPGPARSPCRCRAMTPSPAPRDGCLHLLRPVTSAQKTQIVRRSQATGADATVMRRKMKMNA